MLNQVLYYRVLSFEDFPDFGTRQYQLISLGLEDPNCHVVGLIPGSGDVPHRLQDGDNSYEVQIAWMADQTRPNHQEITVFLTKQE